MKTKKQIDSKEQTFLQQLEEYLKEMPFNHFNEYLKAMFTQIDQETVELTLLNTQFMENDTQKFISLWTKMLLGMDLNDVDYERIFTIAYKKIWFKNTNINMSNLIESIHIMNEYNPEFVHELIQKYDFINEEEI